jgi:uncharacterized delta-60 repeat protein
LPNLLLAQPGSLDLSFGQAGKIVTDVGQIPNVATNLLIQPDGKLVSTGYSVTGTTSSDILMIRYLPAGSPDPSFGINGVVRTVITGRDIITASCIQNDGKILVGGYAFNGNDNDFAMVRYNTDGTRDGSFGSGGIVLTDFENGDDKVSKMAIQPDGKILLVGSCSNSSNSDFDIAVARYDIQGVLDVVFGQQGKIKLNVGSPGLWQSCKAVALQADGKILLSGYTEQVIQLSELVVNFVLIRVEVDGKLDNGFADHGIAVTPIGKDDVSNAIAIQGDGKIVSFGSTESVLGDPQDLALVRYTPDGQLDLSFGQGGIVTKSLNVGDDFARSVLIQPDGKFLLSGFTKDANKEYDIFVTRFNDNGSPDASFGAIGNLVIDFYGKSDFNAGIAFLNDKSIVAFGHVEFNGDYDFALAKIATSEALPVRLISFQVKQAEANTILSWKTASESGSRLFEIQKSLDGLNWQFLANQNAAGESSESNEYSYSDKKLIFGRCFYRPKMIDLDGSYTYSIVRNVYGDTLKENSAIIFPNPTSGSLSVQLPANAISKEIMITDSAGKSRLAARSRDSLDISFLPSGVYTIHVTGEGGEQFSSRLVLHK